MFDNLTPGTRKGLGYLLSLPERGIRSLAAVAGGTTLLLTETLTCPNRCWIPHFSACHSR